MKIFKSGAELINLVETFKRIPFLEPFDSYSLSKIIKSSQMVRYEAGETIFLEGASSNELYLLFDGRVKIIKDHELITTLDKIGDIFGEMAMLNHQVRTATVVADTTTWCLVVDVSFINQLSAIERNACYAVLYSFFSQLVAERLMATTAELVFLKQQLATVRQELAKLKQAVK